jgi:hypothetical protein
MGYEDGRKNWGAKRVCGEREEFGIWLWMTQKQRARKNRVVGKSLQPNP